MYPTDEKLIDDFKKLIRIHGLRLCLFHKLEELKHEFKDKIEEYREIERVIDPESKQENTKESVKQIEFEIEKVNQEWIISRPGSPDDIKIIPPEILKHITSSKIKPGIVHMVNDFKTINGKIFDFTFERQTDDYFTCSIREKATEKAKKETPKQAKADNKTEDLKTLLTYLLNHGIFFNAINEQFIEKWKPLLDKGCITKAIEG